MPKKPPYEIRFDPLAIYCFAQIENKYDSMLEAAIEEQLRHTPDVPTRNRKRLIEGTTFGATWELRCGPKNRLRVFCDVDAEGRRVIILAIAVKIGNRLFVGNEEFEL